MAHKQINSREDLINLYRQSLESHGDSPAAVLWPKGRQDLRFEALTQEINPHKHVSILDFGCGLAHLKDYLDKYGFNIDYTGVDIVPEFLELAKKRQPDGNYVLVEDALSLSTRYDYVLISGTFNIVEGDIDAHKKRVEEALIHLFKLSRISLAVNLMTDDVDFMQADAYHVSPESVTSFVRNNLSRRLRLDQGYMPYEFTVIALSDDSVVTPDNVYSPRS